jgi:hypothetical protein
MLAFDVTPTTDTLYEEKRGREETVVGNFEKQRRAVEETLFIGYQGQVPLLKREADSTATAEELRAPREQQVSHRDQDDDEVLKARDVRLALLARKYEGVASVEDTARLQILTERLRKLSPRVTDKDVEQITEMVAEAEGIAARLAAVKEKFGLR